MDGKWYVQIVILILVLFGFVAPGRAGEPTQQIQQTTDKILSILSDPAFKDASRSAERKMLIGKTVDERFDWEEMARRSLARHWTSRTPDEKKEFVQLFRNLLERTYMDKVEDYSGESVRYEGESVDANYAAVKVTILTSKNKEIPVEYRVAKKGPDWLVYDISIEGVSLVNNYRTQFNSILAKSPYQELLKRLKDKVSSPQKE